jgi:hypothetical protein
MTISYQAKTIADALQKWLNEGQGKAVVVPDLLKLWEVAYQTTAYPRALVCYAGESLRGDFSVAAALGRVDRQWLVAIIRGTGFPTSRGIGLTDTVMNGPAFYDQVEEGRDVIRCLRNISVELPLDFKRIYPMEKLDDFISGYIVEFSTAVDLPQMSEAPDVVNIYSNMPVAYVTPDIFSDTQASFGEWPAGDYIVRYINGALIYADSNPQWSVNASNEADGHRYKIVHDGGDTTINGPGNATLYASQSLAEAGNSGLEVSFTHTGGSINMYLFDSPYGDNLTGNPNPTFGLFSASPYLSP